MYQPLDCHIAPMSRKSVVAAASIVGLLAAFLLLPNPAQAAVVTNNVPGPLPIFGAAAALGFSRRLRTRIGTGSQKGAAGSQQIGLN
jgi:hypothetical protein